MNSYTSVGEMLGISANTVIRAFDKLKYTNANLKNVEVLAIDEFKGNTGGEKYNCIIAGPKNKGVLDILPKRRSNYLIEHFLQIDKNTRDKVKCFISDMWIPYRDLASTFF